MASYKKLVLSVAAFAAGFAAFAAEISFTGGVEGTDVELTTPENWQGGICPGEDDIALISNVAGTDLTMASDMAVKGVRFTSVALMKISPANAVAEVLPRLAIGDEGISFSSVQAKDTGLVLEVPVDVLTEQTWFLNEGKLATYQAFGGTAKLTFSTAYSIDHYMAPRYDGELCYHLPNVKASYAQYVFLREEAKWANTVSDKDGSYSDIGFAIPAGQKWDWNKVFPAGTTFNASNWMTTVRFSGGGISSSELTIDSNATSTMNCGSTTGWNLDGLTFNQIGGTYSVGNVFGFKKSAAKYVLTDGTFNASPNGYVAILAMDIGQITGYHLFDQRGGVANINGLMLGGAYGDWEAVKSGLGHYVLGGGTLNSKYTQGWNSFGGGLCIGAKQHNRGNTSCAPGVFTQTGGVANVEFVRLGVESPGNSYNNTCSFGMIDIAGGRFNLGSSGFVVGSTWNYSTSASYESNSCYRVRLTGGTFAPSSTVVKAQMDFPPSGRPVNVEPQRDVIFQAPVWGEGTLRKTGVSRLTLSDVSRFTGSIEVNEGELNILSGGEDPDDATCIKWTGDSAAATYADGATVEEWAEANNGGERKAVAYTAAAGSYQPSLPTLEANAFGAHAGVKFSASGMMIPKEANPVCGQTNWSFVVVFKTTQAGGCDVRENSYNWCYTVGLLGNSATGWQDDSWGVSFGAAPVSQSLVFGNGYSGGSYSCPESVRGNRSDGKVHVLVCTQSTVDQVSTVNMDGIMSSAVGNRQKAGAHARLNAPCYLGFHSSDAMGKDTESKFRGVSFDGTFAEIRFYQDRVLTLNEQNALIRALTAKYSASSAAEAAALPTPAAQFDADTIVGGDGDQVETWAAKVGEIEATKTDAGDSATAPTLVKGGFIGHNALKFVASDKSALGIGRNSIPWLGQKRFGAAIVFRTTTDGLDDQHDTYNNSIQGRGLLSTSGPQKSSVNGFSLSFRKDGTLASFYKTTNLSANEQVYRQQLIYTKKPCFLNDGAVHIAVTTYDETAGRFRLMIDGYFYETAFVASAAQDSSQNLLIGSLCQTADKYFTGEIAEIKLFDASLSRVQMQAVTDDWAAKYKTVPLANALCNSLADAAGSGIAASNLSVAAGAKLNMPGATLGAGQVLSVAGDLAGDLKLEDGATLKLSSGANAELESLSASGEVFLDVTGYPASEFPKWKPLVKVGSYSGEGSVWRVVGGDPSTVRTVQFRDGYLGIHSAHGMYLIVW